MLKRYGLLGVGFLLLVLSVASAWAADTTIPTVMDTLKSTATGINAQLTTTMMRTLGAAITLQWIITYWKEAFTGDLNSILVKLVGSVTWGGICIWAMGNQEILSNMFNGYLDMASTLSGVKFTPDSIWGNGVDLQNNMVVAFNKRTGASDSLFSAVKNILPSMILMFACALILVSYAMIALSVFVAQAEFWMMFSVTPIAIALLGLQAFRDQGMAPLKGVISLAMRVIILAVIVKILGTVQTEVMNQFNNMPQVNPMQTVWYALGGVFACAVMAFSAGKIAAAIASGSSNFSGSDAMSGGLQMIGTATQLAQLGAMMASPAFQKALESMAGQAGGGSAAGALGAGAGSGSLGVSNAIPPPGAGPSVGGSMPSNPDGGGGGGGPAQPSAPQPSGDSGGSAAPAGDASSASIGGSDADGGGKSGGGQQQSGQGGGGGKSGGLTEQAGKAFEKLAQNGTQDNHSVNIQMNARE